MAQHILITEPMASGAQHILITGPMASGKTTLANLIRRGGNELTLIIDEVTEERPFGRWTRASVERAINAGNRLIIVSELPPERLSAIPCGIMNLFIGEDLFRFAINPRVPRPLTRWQHFLAFFHG